MFEHMSQSECIARLVAGRIGRVGVVVEEAPHVLPVNYTSMSNGAVVFRTAEGSLLAQVDGRVVVFEVDGFDVKKAIGWSVCVHGRGHEVTTPDATATRRAHRPRLDHLGTRTPRPLVLDHTRRAHRPTRRADGRPVRPRLDRGSRLVIPSRKDTNDEQ